MTSARPARALQEDFALLCAATGEAATLAHRYYVEGARSWNKKPGHPVSEADLAVNELLQTRLVGARPAYGWLSEETTDDRVRLTRRRVWVVDPIDGTRAFLRRCGQCAVSVALVEDGRPVAGAVANPATGERFDALRGGGARKNGRALGLGSGRALREATVLGSETMVRRLGGAMEGTRFRKVHSIAYRMALIAAGEEDAAVAVTAMHDWDLAAAEVVVREAGGAVSDLRGAELVYNRETPIHQGVVAAGPTLQSEMIRHFAQV